MKCKRKSDEERPEEIKLTKGKACKKPDDKKKLNHTEIYVTLLSE